MSEWTGECECDFRDALLLDDDLGVSLDTGEPIYFPQFPDRDSKLLFECIFGSMRPNVPVMPVLFMGIPETGKSTGIYSLMAFAMSLSNRYSQHTTNITRINSIWNIFPMEPLFRVNQFIIIDPAPHSHFGYTFGSSIYEITLFLAGQVVSRAFWEWFDRNKGLLILTSPPDPDSELYDRFPLGVIRDQIASFRVPSLPPRKYPSFAYLSHDDESGLIDLSPWLEPGRRLAEWRK